jgi:hypothetical protein
VLFGTSFARLNGMRSSDWLGVTAAQALRFFFETLRDVSESPRPATEELLYNASVLAHFATTSTVTADFPAAPADLMTVFDLFVLDRSRHDDPEIMEAAAAQCLLLTGFFHDQMKGRYNVDWYATLGTAFFAQAAQHNSNRARMMETMASRFEFWRRQQRRLAHELRDLPRLVTGAPDADPPYLM